MPFDWRWPWKRRRPPPDLGHLEMILYTRVGCHLCETAWECLCRAQHRYRFAVTVVDVDTDPVLAARHGDSVPVVTVNGQVRFRGAVNPVLLARLLEAEAARRGDS